MITHAKTAKILALIGLTCGICNAAADESTPPSHPRTKHAWIVKFYTPKSLQEPEVSECTASLSAEERASGQIVQIMYRHSRRMIYTVGLLPANVTANVGDKVDVTDGNCAEKKIWRILKALPGTEHS